MMIANILISMFTPLSNSTNEKTVQSLIPASPILMFIAAGLFAPILEEITFRKTFQTIFKKKLDLCYYIILSLWLYSCNE